jgi:hypothetical protein
MKPVLRIVQEEVKVDQGRTNLRWIHRQIELHNLMSRAGVT